MNLKKRLMLTNLSLLVFPPVVTLVLSVLAYMVLAAVSGSGFQYAQYEKAVLIRYELFSAATVIWRQSPETVAREAFVQYLDARLSDVSAEIIVTRDGVSLYSTDGISPDDPGFDEGLASAASTGLTTINQVLYVRHVHRFAFPDGKPGAVYLLVPTDRPVEQAGLFALFSLAVLLLSGLATHIYGSSRTVRTIASPLVRLSGTVSAMSDGNLADPIIEQGDEEIRQLHRSLEILRLKLQESLAMREKIDENRQMLISSISHDLKTPITSIRGYVEGLLDGVADTPDKQRKYLETVNRKAGQLDKMIDDLVFYSRLELDQVPYHFVWTDPVHYLTEIVEEAQVVFQKEGIILSWENQLENSCRIRIDRAQMQRVLANLFENARKYRKGDQDRVTITLRDKQEHIIIDVADTGIGIPADSLPYLFDRFFRADSSRSRADGSGLGLAIARQIVQDHKGSIWVRSKEQTGTTFSIALKKETAVEHEEL